MKIEFYKKATNEIYVDTDDYYFVMNNEVYCDNNESYESQCATVSFDDFIKPRPDIGWRITQ